MEDQSERGGGERGDIGLNTLTNKLNPCMIK